MKLTAAEEEYTRQVAAEIGRDPDDLIAEGEHIKGDGYRQAAEAAQASVDASRDAGGRGLHGSAASPANWRRDAERDDPEAGG